jgi:hypothetical protein
MRRLGASQLFGDAAGTHVRNCATHLFSTEAPYKCAQLTRILLCKLFILNNLWWRRWESDAVLISYFISILALQSYFYTPVYTPVFLPSAFVSIDAAYI